MFFREALERRKTLSSVLEARLKKPQTRTMEENHRIFPPFGFVRTEKIRRLQPERNTKFITVAGRETYTVYV